MMAPGIDMGFHEDGRKEVFNKTELILFYEFSVNC